MFREKLNIKNKIILCLCLIAAALFIDITFFHQRHYDLPVIEFATSEDKAVISRGEYLVYGPGRCADCHGNMTQREAIARGEKVALSGGFFEDIFLGKITFPNITTDETTGIGTLSNGELARFFRTGVNHRGEYGLPFMNYHRISENDLTAIIAFLRTQKPVSHQVSRPHYNFWGKLTLAYFLHPEEQQAPWPNMNPQAPSIKYGQYLVEAIASCRECHTNRSLVTGRYLSEFYAGGMPFEHPTNPELSTISPSLIPSTETGKIAGLTKDQFIARMQSGRLLPWSPMPWGPYSRMNKNDIESIYLYLSTLKQNKKLLIQKQESPES